MIESTIRDAYEIHIKSYHNLSPQQISDWLTKLMAQHTPEDVAEAMQQYHYDKETRMHHWQIDVKALR